MFDNTKSQKRCLNNMFSTPMKECDSPNCSSLSSLSESIYLTPCSNTPKKNLSNDFKWHRTRTNISKQEPAYIEFDKENQSIENVFVNSYNSSKTVEKENESLKSKSVYLTPLSNPRKQVRTPLSDLRSVLNTQSTNLKTDCSNISYRRFKTEISELEKNKKLIIEKSEQCCGNDKSKSNVCDKYLFATTFQRTDNLLHDMEYIKDKSNKLIGIDSNEKDDLKLQPKFSKLCDTPTENLSFIWETPKTTFVDNLSGCSVQHNVESNLSSLLVERDRNYDVADISRNPFNCGEMNTWLTSENVSLSSLRSLRNKSLSKPSSSKQIRRQNQSFIQKMLRLKLTRRIPPNWPVHISFSNPYRVASEFTRKYSKKLNIFKKLFGHRRTQDKYSKIRGRCSTISSSTSNNNTMTIQKQPHFELNVENQLPSCIARINNRLDQMENDIKEIKELLRNKLMETQKSDRTNKDISTNSKSETLIPPPPPLPPPPLHLLSMNMPQRFYGSSDLVTPHLANEKVNVCKSSSLNHKLKNEKMFVVTADDIKNVKLRKTPVNPFMKERKSPARTDPRIPVVSIEMLRSVKLKPCKGRRINDKRRLSISPYSLRETTGSRSSSRYFGSFKENAQIKGQRRILKIDDESVLSGNDDNMEFQLLTPVKRNLFSVDESDC